MIVIIACINGRLHGWAVDGWGAVGQLALRSLPLDVLRSKAQEYVDAQLIGEAEARVMIQVVEDERGLSGLVNTHLDGSDSEADGGTGDRPLAKLTSQQLQELLQEREKQMADGGGNGETDQIRVYKEIVDAFSNGRYLRMMAPWGECTTREN